MYSSSGDALPYIQSSMATEASAPAAQAASAILPAAASAPELSSFRLPSASDPSPGDSGSYLAGAAQSAAAAKSSADFSMSAAGVARAISGFIDYTELDLSAAQYDLQAMDAESAADVVEIRALQTTNAMREEFAAAAGSEIASAAARGVRAAGGSMEFAIESSARNLGEDMQIIEENALNQARASRAQAALLRAGASVSRRMGRVALADGIFKGVLGLMTT
jgi:hypothetical protein